MPANCPYAISRLALGLELCKCVFLKRSDALTNFYLAGSLFVGITVYIVGPIRPNFAVRVIDLAAL